MTNPTEDVQGAVRRLTGFGRSLAVVLIVAGTVGVIAPIQIDPDAGAELWWQLILHDAFLQGREHGSEIMFTYGPWGFVICGYHWGTMLLVSVLRVTIVMAGTIALWDLLVRTRGRAVATVVGVSVPVVAAACWPDPFTTWLPFLLLLYAFELPERRRSSVFVLLMLVAALLSLTKFSTAVAFALAVAAVSIDDVMRRKIPVAVLTWTAALVTWWILGGQRISSFGPWLKRSFALTAAYGEAMMIDTPPAQDKTLGVFVIMAVAFLGLVVVREVARAGVRGLIPATAWLAMVVLVFKGGYVRADHFHYAQAIGSLSIAQLAYAAAAVREDGRHAARTLGAAFLLPVVLGLHMVSSLTPEGLARSAARTARDSVGGVASLLSWRATRASLEDLRVMAVDAIGASAVVKGRADMYPAPNDLVLREGVDYRPRPVFMSYAVLTGDLAELNREHLVATRTDSVLFRIDAIDGRLPSLEDGASWPVLLLDYDHRAEDASGAWLWLQRREIPRASRFEFLGSIEGRIGTRLELPPSEALLLGQVELRLSLAGHVVNVPYKPPRLVIRVETVDGAERTFRFPRTMGASTFLLSPLVQNTGDFAAVIGSGPAASSAVRAITIDTDDAARRGAYRQTYWVQLTALHVDMEP